MDILVFGDIHGRTQWEKIIEKEFNNNIMVIFLGDYVSSHENIKSEDQINNLNKILDFKEKNPNNVILLRGNHDLQHLGYYWAECSSFFPDVYEIMSETEYKTRFLNLTQWIYKYNDILFSHAGVSNKWFTDSKFENLEDINKEEPNILFAFRSDRPDDYCGDSPTQPPVWIRPTSFIYDASENDGWNFDKSIKMQVVGHTRFGKILKFDFQTKNQLYYSAVFCDDMPNHYCIIHPDDQNLVEVKNI